ncbi:hypothetical protein [Allonocardiopsis opalescens]|uniref:Uncharacterized protein n=1 Tax=Allonocardiopsis opalescens TaxID=1144618 RepID=A0A2T0Q2U5_9ACTN|nr:hypothetical protein [Allonocardiopsis opalescens]PRX98114.1 hypothetical protein CLV72_105467 [Allonocardiopsis opalescens]
MRTLRAWYGAGPTHLLLTVCSFAVAGYAGLRLLGGDVVGLLLWTVGAALLHDLVLVPLYTAADRAVRALDPRRDASWINHVRVPAFVSAVLFVVWSPLILGLSGEVYAAKTGLDPAAFAPRWLLITAALFAASAAVLAARSLIARHRAARGRPPARPGA